MFPLWDNCQLYIRPTKLHALFYSRHTHFIRRVVHPKNHLHQFPYRNKIHTVKYVVLMEVVGDIQSSTSRLVQIDRHGPPHCFPAGGAELPKFIIARHPQTRNIFWTGMPKNKLPSILFLRRLQCCQIGCRAPISGYIDRTGDTPVLILTHPYFTTEGTHTHAIGEDAIKDFLPKLIHTRVALKYCRICHRAFSFIKPFKNAIISKCNGGLHIKAHIHGTLYIFIILYTETSLRCFPEALLPKGPHICCTIKDFLETPSVITFPEHTTYGRCFPHTFDVSYPVTLFLKRCPQCSLFHSPTIVPSKSDECFAPQRGRTLRYRMWDLSKIPKTIRTRTKIRSNPLNSLIVYADNVGADRNTYFEYPVRFVSPLTTNDLFPGVLYADEPAHVLCTECSDRNTRTRACCWICGKHDCTGCLLEADTAIRPAFRGTPGEAVICFRCGWMDDAGTMAALDEAFPFDREGLEGTLHLCSKCFMTCERCDTPSRTPLCPRCTRARIATNNFSVVHENHAHMKTTSQHLV